MELSNKIKTIVSLTVDDFISNVVTQKDNREVLIKRVTDELLDLEMIEIYNTYEVSILALKNLNYLCIVDLEFIHNEVLDGYLASYDKELTDVIKDMLEVEVTR